MKTTLRKRIGALALCVAMVLSMSAGLTPALAANQVGAGDGASNGKPKLYIDFLGDNKSDLSQLSAPLGTAPTDTAWKYSAANGTPDQTIFWVGVGIDNIDELTLANNDAAGTGLSSLELGFYYNSTYVTPYTGGDYRKVLSDANIGTVNTKNQWSSDYEVAAAVASVNLADEKAAAMVNDPDTQEYAPPTGWDMTYLSIRRTNLPTGETAANNKNRFSDAAAGGNQYGEPHYVAVIPFVLRKIDTSTDPALCFRLVRNALAFSIGGGEDGNTAYGAWEKRTANDPDHNLKLMLDFTGDLNIFTGARESKTYSATLTLSNGGRSTNTAELGILNDPAPSPVTIKRSGDVLTGLTDGTEMALSLECAKGFTVKVTVIGSGGAVVYTAAYPAPGSTTAAYRDTFTMPESDVTVHVDYASDGTSGAEYVAALSITDSNPPDPGYPNTATMRYTDAGGTVHSVSMDGGSLTLPGGRPVSLTVGVNSEYDAAVRVTRADGTTESSLTTIVSQQSYSFTMPSSDVTVSVTFTKAAHHSARLAVTNDPPGEAIPANMARLSFSVPEDTPQLHTTDDVSAGDAAKNDTQNLRDGRTVTVTIPSSYDKAYAVKSVVVSSPQTPEEFTAFDATTVAANENYTFVMPKYDVVVTVTFAKVPTYGVKLVLAGAAAGTANTAGLSGTDARGTHKTDLAQQPDPVNVIYLFQGTTVYITAAPEDGYTASVEVKRHNNDLIVPSGTAGTGWQFDLTNGDPDGPIVVTVTFTAKAGDSYTAKLEDAYAPGTPFDDGNAAEWQGAGGENPITAESGDHLEGHIYVAPGYHIQSVVGVTGAGAAVPLSVTGDGYNGGAGTGSDPVKVTFTMPGDSVVVRVTYAKDSPPAEPDFQARLVINDMDGKGNPFILTNLTTGSAGETVSAKAGETVTASFSAAPGYAVTGVTVTAAAAGVGVTWGWTGAGGIELTMPASHVTVFVTVKKTETAPSFDLTLEKQEYDSSGERILPPLADNTAALGSLTVGSVSTDSGTAAAGTTLAFTAAAAHGYVVAAVLVTDSSGTHPLAVTGLGTQSAAGSIEMPPDAVKVAVLFTADGTVSPPGQHLLTLIVDDPDNQGAAAANTAQVYINGAPMTPIARLGGTAVFSAAPGDEIIIETAADTGYSVRGVTVAPPGLGVTPVPQGGGKYAFTMPDGDATATAAFRKGTAQGYSVNLVLRGGGSGTGTLGAYGTAVYSATFAAGDRVTAQLFADSGSYIRAVTVTPEGLGVSASFTGAFARQEASFIMPAANCILNVYLEEGWPAGTSYNATLKVTDPTKAGGNHAALTNKTYPASTGSLTGTSQGTITGQEYDVMEVEVNTAEGYLAEITVADSAGHELSYIWSAANVLSFAMPAGAVTVEVRYRRAAAADDYIVTLHVMDGGSGDTVELKNFRSGNAVQWPGQTLSLAARPGDSVAVNAAAGAGRYVLSTLVMQGGALIPHQNSGGWDAFVMPAADVDVYVTFGGTPPITGNYTAVLAVTADNAAAGMASMTDLTDMGNSANVQAQSIGQITVAPGGRVRIEAFPDGSAGYHVVDIRLTPAGGTAQPVPFTWTGDGRVEFTMPARNVAVEVVLERAPAPAYRAQIVVNGTAAMGSAFLRESGGTGGGAMLSGLTAGTAIDAVITVQPGYAVTSILVVPRLSGGDLTPAVNANVTQTVSFTMPANDVVVYVSFGVDPSTVYTATLTVGHAAGSNTSTDNAADISSPRQPAPTTANLDTLATAPAAAGETVTVLFRPADGYKVDAYTVKDAGGNSVAYTAIFDGAGNLGGITFLMPAGNVSVNVLYTDSAPTERKVTLHVDDKTGGVAGLKVELAERGMSGVTWPDGNPDYVLTTAAAREITVTATLPGDTYVAEAYAILDGQVYPFTMPTGWGAGSAAGSFYMPSGDVDVYVVLSASTVEPPQDYAALLLVNGPVGAGSAIMTLVGSAPAEQVTVQSGDPHQSISAPPGSAFTVVVTVNSGYVIDSVSGTRTTVTATGRPNEYTFTLPSAPAANVGVVVTLKRSGSTDKNVTLHVAHASGSVIDSANAAEVSYTDVAASTTYRRNVTAADGFGVLEAVPQGTTVTLTVKPRSGYYVDAAYALAGTALVPLSRTLEGAAANTTATFAMPAAATDVYVFYKAGTPPATPWYSVVFMATDLGQDGTLNVGGSRASIAVGGGAPTTVSSDAASVNYISVNVGTAVALSAAPGEGYSFNAVTASPAVVTFSPASSPAVTEYTFSMPGSNVAVVMDFLPGAVLADLTLTVKDPDNGGVTNKAEIALDGAAQPALSVISADSTGGSATKGDVPVGTKAALTITPAAGFTPWAEFITTPAGGTGTAVSVPLARTESGGIAVYTGSFTTAATDGELVVHMVKAPVVVVQVRHAGGVTADPGNTVTLSYAGPVPPLVANSVNAGDPVPGSAALPVPGGTVPVNITVAPSAGYQPYSVTVTDQSGANIALTGDVLTDATGTGSKAAWFTMPGGSDGVVTVTVTFGAEIIERDLALELLQSNGLAAYGWADVTWNTQTKTLTDANLTDKIEKVKIGETVTVAVHPDRGYRAKLKLESTDSTGAVVTAYPTVTEDGAAFAMPARDAKLTVEFVKGYTATLVLNDTSALGASTVNMEADDGIPPLTVTVSSDENTKKVEEIPGGAHIRVMPTVAETSELRGVLVTRNDSGSTTALADPDGDGVYDYEVNGDVTVTVIVEDKNQPNPDYLAAVELKGDFDVLGNGAKIKNTADPSAQHGSIWTAAKAGDQVNLAVSLAPGYYAGITAKTADGSETAIALLNGDGNARATLTEPGTYHFTMPSANVAVTVTYFEKDYIAQLFVWQADDNPGNKAAISYSDRYGHTQSVDYDRGILVGLRKNDTVTARLTPAPDSAAVGVAVTREGSGSVLAGKSEADTYTFDMPAADVAVSAVFGKSGDNRLVAAMNLIAKENGNEIDIRDTLNTASIKNNAGTISPAAPTGGPYTLLLSDGYGDGGTWVTANPGDVIEIDFNAERTENGGTRNFYALATARTESGAPLTVLQTGAGGQGTARFIMPAANVQATVTFDTTSPTPGTSSSLTLELTGHAGLPANTATLTDGVTQTLTLTPDGASADPLTGTLSDIPANTAMSVSAAADSGYRVASVILTAGGLSLPLALDAQGSATFQMPGTAATLTVTYAAQYTATLHLSPKTLTGVTMEAAPGVPSQVGTDGGKIAGIPDGTTVKTTAPSTADGRTLRAVLATTEGTGTTYLADGDSDGVWNHTIAGENVDITAVYDDGDPATPDRYVAAVSQSNQNGGAPAAGNAAAISAGTAGLASGSVWTEAEAGDTVTLAVTLAPGYSAVVTAAPIGGGAPIPLTYWGTTANQVRLTVSGRSAAFTMPAANVQVSVVFARGYTATLSVPGSNPAGSSYSVAAVTDGVPGTLITADGESLTGLSGGETISATVTPGDGNETVAVVVTKESGSTFAVWSGTSYDYAMPVEDITVIPVVTATSDGLYIAAADSTGAGGPRDAVTAVTNGTESGHPAGAVWAAGKKNHQMEVRFTTEPGTYAVVTAKDADGKNVSVLQLGVTGSGRAWFVMPAANVQVTVAFSHTPPAPVDVTLVSTGHGGKAGNEAVVTHDGTDYRLTPIDTNPVTGAVSAATPGDDLYMEVKRDPTYSVKSVELSLTDITGGPVITITLDAANKAAMLVPVNDVTITFTYSDTPPTPQPWDPAALADATATPALEKGHLTAEKTAAQDTVTVTVPVLRAVAENDVDKLYNVEGSDPAFHVNFRFYYDKDGVLTELTEGTDVTLTNFTYPTDVYSGYTSARFDLTGLTDDIGGLITSGGILYITATRTGTLPNGAVYPESDKTQLVLPGPGLGRPYDSRNKTRTSPELAEGYIYAANYGDKIELEIPELMDSTGTVSSAENANLEFKFYVFDGTDYLPLTVDDIVLTRNAPDGTRFVITPKETTSPGPAALLLLGMMDNQSSIGADGKTRLFVTATLVDNSDPANPVPGPESGRTEIWLPKYISLQGEFISYAPTHEAVLSLWVPQAGATDLSLPEGYEMGVHRVTVKGEGGSGLWRQSFEFRSSELVSPRTGEASATYMLVIEKTAHITYRRVEIVLDTSGGKVNFEVAGTKEIRLIGGDVNGDQGVKGTDRSILVNYIAHNLEWSYTEDPSDPEWDISTYNSATWAYVCDLNGDGYINGADLAILTTEENFNKTAEDYGAPSGLEFSPLAAAPQFLSSGYVLAEETQGSGADEAGEESAPPETGEPEQTPLPAEAETQDLSSISDLSWSGLSPSAPDTAQPGKKKEKSGENEEKTSIHGEI